MTYNSNTDNIEIANCLIEDGLFTFKLYIELKSQLNISFSLIVHITTSQSKTLIKTWYQHLGHPSFANLKHLDNVRGIDIFKIKLGKD